MLLTPWKQSLSGSDAGLPPRCQGLPAPREASLCWALPCSRMRPGSWGPAWLAVVASPVPMACAGNRLHFCGSHAASRGLSMESGQLWTAPLSTWASSPLSSWVPSWPAPLVLQLGLSDLLPAGDSDLQPRSAAWTWPAAGSEQRLAWPGPRLLQGTTRPGLPREAREPCHLGQLCEDVHTWMVRSPPQTPSGPRGWP